MDKTKLQQAIKNNLNYYEMVQNKTWFASNKTASIQTIRNERLRHSVQQRTQRTSNLFSQAF